MLKSLLHKLISNFEASYNYDASYMHEINNVSSSATVRLMLLSGMTGFQGPEKSIWAGAALAATLHGDCGPCAQLMIDRLLQDGLDADQLNACFNQHWDDAKAIGLGYRFARATLANESELECLRTELRNDYGEGALVAASFATVSFPSYPLLKRALGSSESCKTLTIGKHHDIKVGLSL